MIKYLKFLPISLFSLLSTRIIILGTTIPEALALIPLTAATVAFYLIDRKYQEPIPLNESVVKDLEIVKSTLHSFKLAQAQKRF